MCATFAADAPPLATLEYRITGLQLKATPQVVSVPKGVPGSVLVELLQGGQAGTLAAAGFNEASYVEAVLRGPAFEPRRLVAAVNSPLLLPPLNLVGDFQLDNIRLIDPATGETKLEAAPSSIPVHVFDEVLVSRVTSRPLTYDEIKEKGIFIDEQNFRAVEFEVGFVLEGKSFPVKFPVVAPSFKQSTEIIPAAELERRVAEAEAINREIAGSAQLPPELQLARMNVEITGINVQPVKGGEIDLSLKIPPIPALMVIAGNIGFLNQFFSVQIFTENAAPAGSGLSVVNVAAELLLPPGPDLLPAPDYNQPGDDPLRYARIGPDKIVQRAQPIRQVGPDGLSGTADDVGRLRPGEGGQAEFLVEGLQEGLHVMDLKLTADLEGLAAGTVQIQGKAAGSVLVRNPKFSMAFTHPRTIRAGEPYEASVTILNTSAALANLVSVTLPAAALSGGVLESGETVELGTIKPGETATAVFRIRAQRTGSISFSNLTISDDSVVGRFRLKMGIDERGVALSPDTIGMPDHVNALPAPLVTAAARVLGQALSAATAGQLPAGVIPISRAVVTRRVHELAEAGQRARYGDGLPRVLADLLFDWQGARTASDGFDQILRATNAGREFREALQRQLELSSSQDAASRLAALNESLAARGEALLAASASHQDIVLSAELTNAAVTLDQSALAQTAAYRGQQGHWLAHSGSARPLIRWQAAAPVSQGELSVFIARTNGAGNLFKWTISNAPVGGCYEWDSASGQLALQVKADCAGPVTSTIDGAMIAVTERPPEVLAVLQDPTVSSGRPPTPCFGGAALNYGTILAVLYSKPMDQQSVNVPAAYQLDNGNSAASVQIQPGGRVALVNMRQPLSAIRPRTLTVTGLRDPRGHSLTAASKPVASQLRDGVAVKGRVIRADGNPAVAVPVTLTMFDEAAGAFECTPFTVRVCQVFTDEKGGFSIDFVLAGIPYAISATDTAGLSPEALQIVLQSAEAGSFAREKLIELAASPSVQNTLLGAFATAALPEAIARAEGLDRAIIRDSVESGSPRVGTEVPMALRFRGRGTVTGRALSADGTTPAAGAAVNLFPDPDSREQGRGVFADANGRFAFYGVPLGFFSIQAQSSSGAFRTISDALQSVGETRDIEIALSAVATARSELSGRVVEVDGVTGHKGARVYIGQIKGASITDVVAATVSSEDGYWTAPGIPAGTYDVAGISFDNKRKGERAAITAPANGRAHVIVALPALSTVSGRVETAAGQPVANALVAGGEVLVRTDANGLFRLTGVPVGSRSVSAALERNPAAGIEFTRLGGASVNVLPGVESFVVVRLAPAGRITGRVYDAAGRPVPNVKVAIPRETSFMWTDADANGVYRFDNLSLGPYTLSAPSPPVEKTDTSELLAQIATGNEAQILAAVTEAFTIFTGAANPLLTEEGFNPLTWGFTKINLDFDGQTVVADIRFLRQGTVSGVVLNGQSVPIGARVRLTGIGPAADGAPTMTIRAERDSDPALGTFEFKDQIFVGPWGLQAASPFYPVVLTSSGQISSTDLYATNQVLRFPPVREVNGRLMGRVFYPNGSRVGSGVAVKISFGSDYVIRTDTNGLFDTQIAIPAGGYSVEASDPLTGLRGIASASVTAGLTNSVAVRLLDKGDLEVTILQNNGTLATNVSLKVDQGSFPGDRYDGAAPEGRFVLRNIFEGVYAITASFISGPTTIYGRSSAVIVPGQATAVTIRLAPTATLRGQFLKRDLVTPVGFAQVTVGSLGFASTDASGRFELKGVPLGTYRISSHDPVTGAAALAQVAFSADGEIREIQLVEQARGEIRGLVINSFGNGLVSGAAVTLSFSDGLTPNRTATTGPDGRFAFPGSPAGPFQLIARDPVRELFGSFQGVLPESAPFVEASISIQALGELAGQVFQPDGVTPTTNATVRISGNNLSRNSDTDASGRVQFNDLTLGLYTMDAGSLVLNETRSVARGQVEIKSSGAGPEFRLVLSGVGAITGQVLFSNGAPGPGANVTVHSSSSLAPFTESVIADQTGRFRFDNVGLGTYRLSAASAALGGTISGSIDARGETDAVTITLGDSGAVIGQLVRTNGAPLASQDVLLHFSSQTATPGRAEARTDAQGRFQFNNIPLGSVRFEAVAQQLAGIARAFGSLTNNGETLDLGILQLDEEPPVVVSVTPPNGATGVSINAFVELLFNEPLDPASLNTRGIYLRSAAGNIPAPLQLSNLQSSNLQSSNQLVRLLPSAPLLSQVIYQIVVVDGDRRDALGGIIATGPTDRVGRPLVAPFTAQFTTADQDPPLLISSFPSNNAVQIDPRAVLRFTFNEPVRGSNYTLTLSSPQGAVAGISSSALNGLALVFAPSAALEANQTYTATLSGVADLAGNPALGQPLSVTFQTMDTLGPGISALRLADNRLPVAGSTVPVEALLAVPESGASIRFTQDFQPLGSSTNAPYRVNALLPASASTTFRAIASDRFGNDGPFAELTLAVVSNQPPVVSLIVTQSVISGRTIPIRLSASDDVAITNLSLATSTGFTTNYASGELRDVQFGVPANAIAGSLLSLTAMAADALGSVSSNSLALPILDGTSPSLAILAPEPNGLIEPNAPLPLALQLSDNSSNLSLEVTLTGALGLTSTQAFVLNPNVTVTNLVNVALPGAPLSGGNLFLNLTARDSAGNARSAVRSFRLRDRQPPRLLSVAPTNNAAFQSLWASLLLQFDEALDAAAIHTNSIALLNASGAFIPIQITNDSNPRFLRIIPASPLAPGATYTNRVPGSIADAAGNRWVHLDGAAIPEAGALFVFSTAAITEILPPGGTPIVPGQTVAAQVSFDPGLGANEFQFAFANGPVVRVSAAQTNRVSTQLTLSSNAVEARLRLNLSNANSSALVSLPDVLLNLRPRSGDDDADGFLNGYEADRNMNPFQFDSPTADLDGDGLVNSEELQRGTDPTKSDTDADSLPDAQEIVAGTNPLLPDTDGDGVLDGLDTDPLNAGRAPTLDVITPFELVQNVSTNIAVTGRDTDGNLAGFQIVAISAGEWSLLRWTRSAALVVSNSVPSAAATETLEFKSPQAGTNRFEIIAFDRDQLKSTQSVSAVVLLDTDGDTLPDRNDPDRDNDGLNNDQEVAIGSNPLLPDTDADGIVDGVDPRPLVANRPPVALAQTATNHAAAPNLTVTLQATDPDEGDLVSFAIAVLPTNGVLYATSDGVTAGAAITNLPFTLANRESRVIHRRIPGYTGVDHFSFRATDGFANSLPAVVSLDLLTPSNADLDNDGLPDVFEFANGLNPEQNDAAGDPDSDGLANLAEYQRGTNPKRADSDSDGLNDGGEVNLGTNPLNSDTDGDGLLDGVDPNPLAAGAGVVFTGPASVTIMEGDATNLTIQVACETARISVFDLSPTNTPPVFAVLSSLSITNSATNGVASRQIRISPMFDHAGAYTLVLRAAAQDGSYGIHTVNVTVQDNAAAQLTRWKDPVNGDWNDPGKWTAGLPDATRHAVIDLPGTYSVSLNASATIASLTLGAAQGAPTLLMNSGHNLTLSGSSFVASNGVLNMGNGILLSEHAILVKGALRWSGGVMSGGGLIHLASGTTNLLTSGSGKFMRNGWRLENAGQVVWQDGDIIVDAGSGIIANLPGALWEIEADRSFRDNCFQTVVFENDGLIRRSVGTGRAELARVNCGNPHWINNRGTIEVLTGTLVLWAWDATATHTGNFIVSPNASLEFAGNGAQNVSASLTLNEQIKVSGSSVTINGSLTAPRVEVTAGSLTIKGSATLGNGLISSGTLAFDGPGTMTNLTLNGGVIGGTNSLTVVSNFVWSGGVLSGSGTLRLSATSSNIISGGGGKFMRNGWRLENAGQVVWQDGDISVDAGSGIIANLAGGVWDIQADRSFRDNCFQTVAFENDGLIRRSVGIGRAELARVNCGNPHWINNRGTIEILTGTLVLWAWDATATHTGNFIVSPNASLEFAGNGAQNVSAALALNDQIKVSGSSVTINGNLTAPRVEVTAGSLTIKGSATLANGLISNGTLAFDGSGTVTNLTLNGGVIGGTNSLTVVSNFVWSGGVLSGSGTLRLSATSSNVISGGGGKFMRNGWRLENAGQVVWQDGDIIVDAGSGTIANLAGGVWEIQADRAFRDNCFQTVAFENDGLIRRSVGTGRAELARVNCGNPHWINNRGTIEVLTGTLVLWAWDATATHTGNFIVSPNASLEFAGNGAQNVSAALALNDQIKVSGSSVTINGNLTAPRVEVTAGSLTIKGSATLGNGLISSGTLAFDGPGTMTNLTLNGGVIGGTNSLTVVSNFLWTGGVLSGSGTLRLSATSSNVISGGGGKFMRNGWRLENSGQVVWQDGDIIVDAGSGTIANLAGGVWDIQADRSFRDNCFQTVVFENDGLIRRSVGAGRAELARVNCGNPHWINNRGTIEVLTGTLVLWAWDATATHTGNFIVSPNASLEFAGNGAQNVSAALALNDQIKVSGSSVTINGNLTAPRVEVTAGSLTIKGSATLANGLISNGTLAFDGSGTMTNLTLNGGVIGGTNSLTVISNFVWSGGVLSGSGTLRLSATSSNVISGGGGKFMRNGWRLENAGQVIWQDGDIIVDAGSGTIANLAGGVWEIQADRAFRDNCFQTVAFENDGLIRRSVGTGRAELARVNCGNPHWLNNRGTIEVLTGTLVLWAWDANSTNSGAINVSASATLEFAGNANQLLHPGIQFNGSGNVRWRSPIALATPITFAALTVYFQESASVSGAFLISNTAGGAFRFQKSISLPGALTVGGSVILEQASFTVDIQGALTLLSGSRVENPGQLRAREIADQGATIAGNPPVLLPGGLSGPGGIQALTLSIELNVAHLDAAPSRSQALTNPRAQRSQVVLRWRGIPGANFIVHQSSDLRQWSAESFTITETLPGQFEAKRPWSSEAHCRFYRVVGF